MRVSHYRYPMEDGSILRSHANGHPVPCCTAPSLPDLLLVDYTDEATCELCVSNVTRSVRIYGKTAHKGYRVAYAVLLRGSEL